MQESDQRWLRRLDAWTTGLRWTAIAGLLIAIVACVVAYDANEYVHGLPESPLDWCSHNRMPRGVVVFNAAATAIALPALVFAVLGLRRRGQSGRRHPIAKFAFLVALVAVGTAGMDWTNLGWDSPSRADVAATCDG